MWLHMLPSAVHGKRASQPSLPGHPARCTCCALVPHPAQVSAAGLSAGLSSLAAGGAPPRFLIIDDG